jgi:hypothetical protein
MSNFLSFEGYELFQSKLCFVTNDEQVYYCCGRPRLFLTEKSTAVSLFIDVHTHFPFCNFLAFKMLANSYLGLKDDKFFSQVEYIFYSGASLNSAKINELMIANRNSLSRVIKSVITALQTDGDRKGCREYRVAVRK